MIPPPHAPCGVCDRLVEDYERFSLSGWLVHRRCGAKNVDGSASMGDDRFGVAIRGRIGPSRPRTLLLKKILLRFHLRYDRATDRGAL